MLRSLCCAALLAVASGFAVSPSAAATRSAHSLPAIRMAAAMRTNDMVKVISGDAKGTVGKVLMVDIKKGKVVVEGVNVKTKHVKPMKEGESGSLLKKESPIHISNVQLTGETAPVVEAAPAEAASEE